MKSKFLGGFWSRQKNQRTPTKIEAKRLKFGRLTEERRKKEEERIERGLISAFFVSQKRPGDQDSVGHISIASNNLSSPRSEAILFRLLLPKLAPLALLFSAFFRFFKKMWETKKKQRISEMGFERNGKTKEKNGIKQQQGARERERIRVKGWDFSERRENYWQWTYYLVITRKENHLSLFMGLGVWLKCALCVAGGHQSSSA